MPTSPVHLMIGRTVHVREAPFRRSFSHAVALIEIDIDRLEEAGRIHPLFGVATGRPIAFHPADQGERREGANLRDWANARFAEAGVDARSLSVSLIAFPRVWGFGFSPISLWIARAADGAAKAVVYEVHNTFGEAHAYACALEPGAGPAFADKAFHVSPFFDVSGRYRFTLRPPGERLNLVVENLGEDGRQHVASLVARRRPLSTAAAAAWLLRSPLSGLGVILAIHWQALFVWLRGAGYRPKPALGPVGTTLAKQGMMDAPGRPAAGAAQ